MNKPSLTAALSFFSALVFSASALSATVQLTDVKVRELLPGRMMTAGYLTLENTGKEAVVLTGVTSPAFAEIELHEHVHQDGMMKMQQLQQVEVAAGQRVTFQPGGLHLMMFDAKSALKAGDKVSLSFQFSDGSSAQQQADVVAVTQ
ncbi:copper chaperone PCu(A)C [Rheinheimera sp.]|uniref:copper chaperone PCu(A)C n=1 Tax=Rheinheimera sp. TaxID=1869214 RepID=UPI003AF618EE